MTTAAMVLGVLPLVFASGAGAASRFAIGLVIFDRAVIGTLFTLFVVPASTCWWVRTTRAAPTRIRCPPPNRSTADRRAAMAAPEELKPLTGAAKVFGTFALALATFMNVLDTSIANVSLPAIGGDLGAATTQVTWVITSFAVANAIAVPLTGWLTMRFGAVRLFTASIVLFTLTSLLCGLSPSLQMLIVFRVMQGAVAGPMIPLSQALLLSSFPKAKAGSALAIWAMTTLVAPVMGPLLGGWITDNISWPWIFYINIPVGSVRRRVTWNIYRKRETPPRALPIDKIGLALLVIWVGSLQVMLDKGKDLDWFHSATDRRAGRRGAGRLLRCSWFGS